LTFVLAMLWKWFLDIVGLISTSLAAPFPNEPARIS